MVGWSYGFGWGAHCASAGCSHDKRSLRLPPEHAALTQCVCIVVKKEVGEHWDSRILFFLPGELEMFACMVALCEKDKFRGCGSVCCLFANQGASFEGAGSATLSNPNKFVVLLSADIVATSVSLPVYCVMDSGLEM